MKLQSLEAQLSIADSRIHSQEVMLARSSAEFEERSLLYLSLLFSFSLTPHVQLRDIETRTIDAMSLKSS